MQIPLKCGSCGQLFYTGRIFNGALGLNSSISLSGCYCDCPRCRARVNIPDIEFKETIDGILNVVLNSSTPFDDIQRIVEILKRVTNKKELQSVVSEPWLDKYQKWLPDSPEKIAAYLAIFYTLMQMWTKSPIVEIDYNQFNIEYNQTLQSFESELFKELPPLKPKEI